MRLFAKYLTAALLAVAMLALSFGLGASGAAAAPAADTLPANTCAPNANNVQICTLFAKQGTVTVAGQSIPIWGYATTNAGAPSIPGPTLIVNAGQRVRINLFNRLGDGQRTTLSISGIDLPADMQGVIDDTSAPQTPRARASYFFTPDRPGTYIYEAGLLQPDPAFPAELEGSRQAAMGLSGVLIVRPADGTAYGTAATAYDDEALLAYSEIDPKFNADPANFILQDFNPTFLLINGKAAPATDMINVPAGHKLLLRNANLGMRLHSFGLLGLRQTIIADDGGVLPTASSLYARTIGSGQTMDSMVTVPGSAPDGTLYPLYETGMPGHGPAGVNGMGGMLTFIHVGIPTGDVAAPLVTAAVAPASTDGTTDVTLDATADDTTTGGSSITSASYRIDGGAPVDFTVTGTNVSETLSATLSGADLAALGAGPHTVTVTASDAANNSSTASATVTVNIAAADTQAPVVTIAPDVLPSLSNSATTVPLGATVTDNVGVTSASYTINGVTTPFNFPVGTSLGLNADIDVSGLADGTYQVDVTASDAANNSSTASASITLDRSAPTVVGSTSPATVALGAPVQLSATLSDTASNITGATYDWDNNGAPAALSAQDGAFDSLSESVLAAIDTAGLVAGDHTLTVATTDAAGNVGTADLTVTISDVVFADGFESGNRSAWDQTGGAGRLSVNSAAALEGSFGLRTRGSSFVRKNLAANETQLYVGFYLHPNGQAFTGVKTVFRAMNGNTEAFRVQLRQNGGTYQVRALVRNANPTATTGWLDINDAANTIEVFWQSSASAGFTLKANGIASSLSQPVTTTAYTVNNLRLGAQSSGIGPIYVDGFKATRNTPIFP